MASPVAHSLAGTVIYYALNRNAGRPSYDMLWVILAANLADFDLIPSLLMGNHSLFHRTFSHSLLAAALFALIVFGISQWRNHDAPGRLTLMATIAYLSQLAVDWLSLDPGPPVGIPLLWPFSHEHFAADPALFLNIERENPVSLAIIIHNAKAVLLEMLILGPPALLAWWWSRKRQEKGGANPPA